MKGRSLADFPFMVPSQDHDRRKKSVFRTCSQNILGAALRHFEHITRSEDSIEAQILQLVLVDIRMRWLMHCAMKLVWGTKGDPILRYIEEGVTRTPGVQPQKVRARAWTLEGLTETAANPQFGVNRLNIAKVMVADVDAEISKRALHDHWVGQMKGTLLTAEDLPPFPAGEEYLADLCRSAALNRPEQNLSKKDNLNALHPLDGRKAPGYDGLMYIAYKAADQAALL